MDHSSVMAECRRIVAEAGYDEGEVRVSNFLDYSGFVRDIIAEWPAAKRKQKKTVAFVRALRTMRDNLAQIVEADPMTLYRPAHDVALEFHQSTALVRYFRGGNRISKTQSAIAEAYYVVTGSHPYRQVPQLPADIAVVSYSFTKYAPRVFEPKYITGESGNPLSPVFPEGGKWFNHYDATRKIITVSCPECAAAGRAGSCRHAKSTITLFSERQGPAAMPGAAYALVHFDEQVPAQFLGECLKRLETVRHSGLVMTETPLGGKGFWSHKVLTRDAKGAKLVPGTKQRLVTLHTIDQFSAGLADHDKIRASMELMSPAEVEARVYGRPAAYSATGVFDQLELAAMADEVCAPTRGFLVFTDERGRDVREILGSYQDTDPKPLFIRNDEGPLRVWEHPEPSAQYVIGGDVAQGLIKGDASCASVLRMEFSEGLLTFTMVAQLHGWINPQHFAEDCFKLGALYNGAILVIERNGPGNETIRCLRDWGYWNLFRDVTDQTQVEFAADAVFGVDTTIRSKSTMVSITQQQIKDRRTGYRALHVMCDDTLEELGTFGQELTDSGLTVRFRGESGMPDDRVMSLAVALYVAIAFSLYDFNLAAERAREESQSQLDQHDKEVWEEFRARAQGDEWGN